jgi:hypothetical protein
MGILTMMDDFRDIAEEFRDARDHMIAVYDSEGVESPEFNEAYNAYLGALTVYEGMMQVIEHGRNERV